MSVVPSPSSQFALYPHVHTVPSFFRATVCLLPAATIGAATSDEDVRTSSSIILISPLTVPTT